MMKDNVIVPFQSVEQKFGLRQLHHKSNLLTWTFSSITSLVAVVGVLLMVYICRKNLSNACGLGNSKGLNQTIRMSDLMDSTTTTLSSTTLPLVQPPGDPIAVASKIQKKKPIRKF